MPVTQRLIEWLESKITPQVADLRDDWKAARRPAAGGGRAAAVERIEERAAVVYVAAAAAAPAFGAWSETSRAAASTAALLTVFWMGALATIVVASWIDLVAAGSSHKERVGLRAVRCSLAEEI